MDLNGHPASFKDSLVFLLKRLSGSSRTLEYDVTEPIRRHVSEIAQEHPPHVARDLLTLCSALSGRVQFGRCQVLHISQTGPSGLPRQPRRTSFLCTAILRLLE